MSVCEVVGDGEPKAVRGSQWVVVPEECSGLLDDEVLCHCGSLARVLLVVLVYWILQRLTRFSARYSGPRAGWKFWRLPTGLPSGLTALSCTDVAGLLCPLPTQLVAPCLLPSLPIYLRVGRRRYLPIYLSTPRARGGRAICRFDSIRRRLRRTRGAFEHSFDRTQIRTW